MKKIISILFIVFFAVSANAQMNTVSIPSGSSYVKPVISLTNTDFRITNTTAKYTLLNAAQNFPCTQDFSISLDSISGNHTNVAVAVYGQKSFLKGDWTQIGSTINWKGTTSDTTIVFTNATANRYRSYKIVYTGTGTGVTRVKALEFKLYFE